MLKQTGCLLLSCSLISMQGFAAQPFLTDDADTTPFQHWEIYFSEQSAEDRDGFEMLLPHLEFNYGLSKNLEIDLMLTNVLTNPKDEPNAYGFGDVEVAIKYRFITETPTRPQVSFAPSYSIPTGNYYIGLGNGRGSAELPIWIQKNIANWGEIYGGGGLGLNSQVDTHNFWFGGIAFEHDMNDSLMVGAEIFASQPEIVGLNSTIIVNAGGSYRFTKRVSLQFSIGHSIYGETTWVSYAGLYAFI